MIGQQVSHYRVLRMLGGGGMGVVYEAEDTRLKRRVALKFLPEDLDPDPAHLLRFRREAEAASALNHPHICTIHDIGEHEGRPFIVMEKLEGQSLAQLMNDGAVPIENVLQYAVDLADALAAAHAAGIIHRDIKPANIFITQRGDAKLLDFGLARLQPAEPMPTGPDAQTLESPADLTVPGTTLGTLAYMSPEQARGEPIDARSDVFSLGVVVYEMATGRPLFRGGSGAQVVHRVLHDTPRPPSQVNAALSPAIDPVILATLEKDRGLRVQSASELRANLLRLRRDASSGSAPVLRVPRWNAKRLAGVAAIVIAIAIIAVIMTPWIRSKRNTVRPLASSTASAAAADAYMRGKYFAQRREMSAEAIAAYEEAVRLDPKFAAAWAALARAYTERVYYADDSAAEEKAFVAIEKALSLDPNQAAVYVARGDLLWTRKNGFPSRDALRDYKRALELDPDLAAAHGSTARVLVHHGLFRETKQHVDRAIELEPNNLVFRLNAAWFLLLTRDCDGAIRELERLPRQPADDAALIVAYDCAGRTSEAVARADEFIRKKADLRWLSLGWAALALTRAHQGHADQANEAIRQAIAAGSDASHYHHTTYLIACTYAVMGHREAALDWLERTAGDGFPCLDMFLTDPNLASIRGDPRFQRLAARLKADQKELLAILS